jgi:cyanophycin synthetase
LLIERQSPGHVYRFLFLDGLLLDVLHTGPATVTGNGQSNLYGLVAAENSRRLAARGEAGLSMLSLDRDLVATLERYGLTLKAVPDQGQVVHVKTATNDSCLEDNWSVMRYVSPDLIAEVASAVSATGLELAGVDVITPDISRSLADAEGVILEVNGGPALHRHYHVRNDDQAVRVASPILEHLLG